MSKDEKISKSHAFLRGLSAEEKKGVAKLAGCNIVTLRGVCALSQLPSVRLAKAIDKVTKGRAKKEDLRPDIDWSLIVD